MYANLWLVFGKKCEAHQPRLGQSNLEDDAFIGFALKSHFMNTLFKILTVIALVGLVVGLSDIGDSMFSGFCRAFGAVFFILAFITRTIDKAEHTAS